MIAADDDWRLHDPAANEIVDRQAEARPLAEPEPEDPRRQALEPDAFSCQANPAAKRGVVGEHLDREVVSSVDVRRIAGQRGPAEWSLPLTEQRPDVLRHEAGNVERLVDAGDLGLGT